MAGPETPPVDPARGPEGGPPEREDSAGERRESPPTPEGIPEGDTREAPRTEEEVLSRELDNARRRYVEARGLRRNVVRGKLGRVLGRTIEDSSGRVHDMGGEEGGTALRDFRMQYEELLAKERERDLEESIEHARKRGISDESIRAELPEILCRVLAHEDEVMDRFATERERGTGEKFKNWWRRHTGVRIAVGAGLAGAGILTGGVGFIAARSAWSGLGTFMGAEAALERWSKTIGQKGLVDTVSSTLKGVRKEERAGKIQEAIGKLPEDVLRQEMARLRLLREIKGVKLAHAGTSGARGSDVIQALQAREYEFAAQRFALGTEWHRTNDERADALSLYLKDESQYIDRSIDNENARERVKSGSRKMFAAAAGLTVGVLIGSKAFGTGGEEGAAPTETIPSESAPEPVATAEGASEVEPVPVPQEELSDLGRVYGPPEGGVTEADWRLNLPESPPENADELVRHYGAMGEDGSFTHADWRLNLPKDQPEDVARWFEGHGGALGVEAVPGEATFTPEDWRLNLPAEPPENAEEILKHYEGGGEVPASNMDWRLNLPTERPVDVDEWLHGLRAEEGIGAGEAAQAGGVVHAEGAAQVVGEAAAGETISYAETAERGDSIWKIASRLLEKHYGSDFANLNEAQKTYIIDAIKDKVAADPGAFGLENVDRIVPGETIDFGPIFSDADSVQEVFKNAGNLSESTMHAIVENNEKLAHWAGEHPGEALTSERVHEILSGAPPEAPVGESIPGAVGEGAPVSHVPETPADWRMNLPAEPPGNVEELLQHYRGGVVEDISRADWRLNLPENPPEDWKAWYGGVPKAGVEIAAPVEAVEITGSTGRKILSLIGELQEKSSVMFREHPALQEKIMNFSADTAAGSRRQFIHALERLPDMDRASAKAIGKPLHAIFIRIPKEAVFRKTIGEVFEQLKIG
ncbi:MAG: hypothetical protein HY435_02590 [Candidatus Liptonbacteria bacterium]|nr:hypothetical protein [Candidatus Liptonbacteria bacterium]